MFYINLNNLEFMACHGVLAEEKLTPQKFIVDVKIETDKIIEAAQTDDIKDALNYVEIYEIIREIMMENSYDLIETIAKEISENIISHDASCISVDTKVTKVNPPIEGFKGTVSCEYSAFGVE